jgi:hypothetical protein
MRRANLAPRHDDPAPWAVLADPPRAARPPRADRLRRMQLIRRRRRDLLEDTALAAVLALFLLIVTAGLGVVAILEIPALILIGGSLVAERIIRRRRAQEAAARRPPAAARRPAARR